MEDSTQLLNEEHINIVMALFRKRCSLRPYLINQSFITVDTTFAARVEEIVKFMDKEGLDNTYLNSTNLMDYAREKINSSYIQPWCEVDFIHIPIFVKGNHWIFLVVDRILRQLVLYDSNEGRQVASQRQNYLQTMFRILPTMLEEVEVEHGEYCGSSLPSQAPD